MQVRELLEKLRMATSGKTKGGLLAGMEDDLKQFWPALYGGLRASAAYRSMVRKACN
jgi:hypothetical protein